MENRKKRVPFEPDDVQVRRGDDARQRSWVRVLKNFIQNRALPAHIHLHLLGTSFTKLKQGPFYGKVKIRKIHTKQVGHVQKLKAQKVLMENTKITKHKAGFWAPPAACQACVGPIKNSVIPIIAEASLLLLWENHKRVTISCIKGFLLKCVIHDTLWGTHDTVNSEVTVTTRTSSGSQRLLL